MKPDEDSIPCFFCKVLLGEHNKKHWVQIIGPHGTQIRVCRDHKGVEELIQEMKNEDSDCNQDS